MNTISSLYWSYLYDVPIIVLILLYFNYNIVSNYPVFFFLFCGMLMNHLSYKYWQNLKYKNLTALNLSFWTEKLKMNFEIAELWLRRPFRNPHYLLCIRFHIAPPRVLFTAAAFPNEIMHLLRRLWYYTSKLSFYTLIYNYLTYTHLMYLGHRRRFRPKRKTKDEAKPSLTAYHSRGARKSKA